MYNLENCFQRSMELEKRNHSSKYFESVQSIGKHNCYSITTIVINHALSSHDFPLQLLGYSLGDSYPFHKASQFNLAEIGAVSSDMPFMVRKLL